MKHNQQRISKGKGKKMSISGGGKLAITLDEIVDYAKNLDNKGNFLTVSSVLL